MNPWKMAARPSVSRAMLRTRLAAAALVPLCPAAAEVNFNRDIRPILTENCFPCHGPDPSARKAKLRLDLAEQAVKPAKSGALAIVPGKPEQSELVKRIFSTDPEELMPRRETHKVLKTEQKEKLRQWIQEGAIYQGHWSFTPPVRPPVPPENNQKSQIKNPIDAFIAARLGESGLSPAADRPTLARRAALDLTGLPPSPAEVGAFVADTAPDAFERYVDKLLASPHYGERWARMWMDIARYADSAGYGSDPLRLNIWPWRDWVIHAFNQNVSWDKFSRLQLAGDLLEHPAPEQIIATGFHRNTMTNTEGGTDDEEWRVAAVKDRAAVTAQAWMGLTMGCAQCHSHKFDPISQEEYYRFYALFNQTEDTDQPDERPTLPVPTAEQRAKMDALQKEIASMEARLKSNTPELEKELATWEQQVSRDAGWQALDVATLTTGDAPAPRWEKQSDGSILTRDSAPGAITFHLAAGTKLHGLTGLRLEVLPDDSLPGRGPGHASGGNAVVSDLTVTAQPAAGPAPGVRYVRIEAPGKKRFLHLAEVQVFAGKENLAPQGTASQSSTAFGGDASRANDGNTDGEFTKNSVSHTGSDDGPWWEVDLGSARNVDRIAVWNRKEAAERLTNWRIVALDEKHQPVWKRDVEKPPSPSFETALDPARPVTLTHPSADFSQEKWDVGMAIDGKPDTGWAWSPQGGMAHTAAFEFSQPVDFPGAETQLNISIAQHYGQSHTLGRFRLSVTTAAPPFTILPRNLRTTLATAAAQRTPEQKHALLAFFRPFSKTLADATAQVAEKKKALASIQPVAVPVMRELPPDKRRKTHFLNKGNFLDPGEEVQPGFPAAFGAPPPGTPASRLGVVQWIFSAENPLTARVAVNRFWAQLFGTGIVETEEDFGMQGAYPSHPELLDWLAVEFRDTGWDLKRLLKLIVTSATYCQSSAVRADTASIDPRNRLLSRYPRRRLDAEQVRDQALALSGLLSEKIGGPSVYPPQPDGLWKAAFNGERTYHTSKGEDKYRRGLYTIWRRTVPYPSMATFDAPSRETCTLRRTPTNTPLQAYVTLNDPVYVEAAEALARRILKEGGPDTASRVNFGLTLVLARPADPAAAAALTKLFVSELARCKADPNAAQKLATNYLGPLPPGVDAAEAAAWTAVANVLLNLDGVLMKG